MGLLTRIFGERRRTVTTTADRPLRIDGPVLGFLNLAGDTGAALVQADTAAFGSLFQVVRTSSDATPRCDVLFIYATLGGGSRLHLRSLIRDAQAYIAVVATDNPQPQYLAALKD